jgi:SAM-dependent methyltransferase
MSVGLTRLVRKVWRRIRNRDDFDWRHYTKIYTQELDGKENAGITLLLQPAEFSIESGRITLKPGIAPLHPNHKLIYEAAYRLQPRSVLEVGFGGGYHLVNLAQLLPNAELQGCDLLESQRQLAMSRYPNLAARANLFVHDITVAPPPIKADLVYTQAVVMHIQKDQRHLKALRNIFQASNKYVLLMENWTSHNFFADITRISQEPSFPWKALHMYFVDDGKAQIILVLANARIEGMQPLTRNEDLLKYV